MPRPAASVLICALPRTGSSLVGDILDRNALGRPAEWFWQDDVARNKEAWGVSRFEDYLARVLDEGTSASGVFGVKVMWGYLRDVLFELRRLGRAYEADDVSVLRSFASHSLEPFELVSEELCGEPERVLGEMLAYLGHEGEAHLEPPAFMRRQADSVNEKWIARYRELAGV